MIYRSNLTCPDLTPNFKRLVSRPMGHSFGHDVPSDWGDKADDDPAFGIWKRCGLWTHDEAAILYNVAKSDGKFAHWADIGAHTGWTTAHLAAAATGRGNIDAVDPMLRLQVWTERFEENLDQWWDSIAAVHYLRSDEYFQITNLGTFDGVCIDGCHEDGQPQRDARNAATHLAPTGVIMLHDGVGRPVQDAVVWLMGQGFKARAYFTPHLVFCCWRGDFTPPDHVPDENVKSQLLDGRFSNFDFGKMS